MSSRSKSKKRRKPRQPKPDAAVVEGAEVNSRPEKPVKGPDTRPPAPWGNFPLVQLAVLAGLVFIVLGAVNQNGAQLMIGLGLGSLGGLELSVREHYAGYRSHTTLLAGVGFVVVTGLAYFVAELVLWQCLVVGVLLAVPAFWWIRRVFEKASGGLSYRIR